MNTNHKYDPEDIESLLMHKQFNELYDDEKEFVLQHVKNEEEYNCLRSMLFTLHDVSLQDEWLEPDPSIKKALLKEFAAEKKGGFMVWLNGIFAMPEITWYRRPAFQVAFATAIILIASIWFVNWKLDQNHVEVAALEVEGTKQDTSSALSNGNLFAENLSNQQIPPAPKTVIPQDQSIKFVPPVVAEDLSDVKSINSDVPADNEGVATSNFFSAEKPASTSKDLDVKKAEAKGNVHKEKLEENVKVDSENEKNLNLATDDVSEAQTTIVLDAVSVESTICSAPTATSVGTTTNYTSMDWMANQEDFYSNLTVNINSISADGFRDVLAVLYTAP